MIVISSQLFFCFFLFFFFIPHLSSGADTLDVNEYLSGDSTLVSLDGNFELGFFKPGEPPNYYIGIWYKKVKPTTVVWVANRDTPISDKLSSKLKIIDGNLVLLDESSTQIWSTNEVSTTSSYATVVLLDDGNLVLRYGSSSSSSSSSSASPPIWQSFNHPTYTFLPGSKIGYDKRTNTKQVITSWRSNEDPAVGLFSLEIDQNEMTYELMWNKSVSYRTSGPWDGRISSLVPEMRLILDVSGQIQ
ncbi:hypothetical protein Ccrd_026604 [Cynara cardunculus var. scolymus]|uniref:non-specific serine/threonine protein kinase n=1 Tax=Cynara cardunculus var. scolymus TaxID=59895 RepID=A0A103MM16_CYNCS|nr:hypothetical protein Ccrd_026604 [Cynara cardunculus var. scolymus]